MEDREKGWEKYRCEGEGQQKDWGDIEMGRQHCREEGRDGGERGRMKGEREIRIKCWESIMLGWDKRDMPIRRRIRYDKRMRCERVGEKEGGGGSKEVRGKEG